jgi:trans-aconitate methyltransferase
MPYSEPTFDDAVAKFIAKCNASHYLDIGVGAGKYGRIIRASNPDATIVGIESEAAYLREFQLAKLYTKLIHGRVQRFIARHPDFATDIAIIGDCIEHLKKSDGVNLLHYLVYRTRYIVVIFPTRYVQYSWRHHSSEAHRSVWDRSDFRQFQYTLRKKGVMNMAVIRGYLGNQKTMYPRAHRIAKSKVGKDP